MNVGKLRFKNGVFFFRPSYQGRQLGLAKNAGFEWNDECRRWETDCPRKAEKLINYAHESALLEIATNPKKR